MRKTKLTRLGFSYLCQHDSIDDKELNGFDGDDFFHAKTSFSLETFPQRDMFVVKV